MKNDIKMKMTPLRIQKHWIRPSSGEKESKEKQSAFSHSESNSIVAGFLSAGNDVCGPYLADC
jgi:hypothetical protein